MKGIKIVCVGRVKEEFFKEGIGHYVKEIRKKYPMDMLLLFVLMESIIVHRNGATG